MEKSLLEVNELTMDFGGLRALDHVGLHIDQGEIVALIGPNGAGKTTFFNCITGIYPPTKGEMVIRPPGKDPRKINGLKPNHVTENGLARTFQNIRLFQNMTVLESIRVSLPRAGVLLVTNLVLGLVVFVVLVFFHCLGLG